MDRLDKDLAEIKILLAPSAEELQGHRSGYQPKPQVENVGDESAKTITGFVIGGTWDLVSGKAETSQERIQRAQKADQYAEIAADTFASIPKFSAITGGVARSVLLIDVSGQKSTGDVIKGMAFNFLEGAALNKVGRMGSSESAVGKFVAGRLGAGLTAELATHAISGGGFGLVKSGMSEQSWLDGSGDFSLTTGLKNVIASTTVGTVIGVPAGMAGMRVGRAVTLGLGGSVENSALSATVQKMATGAGSGFASGSVFGGVDAAKSGKSLSEVLDSTWQGGLVGLATGAVTSGFDRTPIQRVGPSRDEHTFRLAQARDAGSAAQGRVVETDHARDTDNLGPTDRMVKRADLLLAPEGLRAAYDKLIYKPAVQIRVEDFAHRLKPPIVETRTDYRLKATAPKTYEEYQAALKKLNPNGEPLDHSKHFWEPFVEMPKVPMRIYGIEGHKTRIVVPEGYAKQLDEVRSLRKITELPISVDKLPENQRWAAIAAVNSGDASKLTEFMTPSDITKLIQAYQAGVALKAHPMANRALPEDLVPILDALPNRGLIKEVHLMDTRNKSDVFKSVMYEAPGFQAAATVGRDGVVELYQAKYGTALYNSMFHEWGHLAKWQSPVFSKMFDLAAVVDHVGVNIDHQATADARVKNPTSESVTRPGMYFPDLHSTRNQDENFAVGMGEEVMGPDPNKLMDYVRSAPVRGITLATALENNLIAGMGPNKSSMSANMQDRARFGIEASRPAAVGTLQTKMTSGTPEQKAAAAQLMAHFGTDEQAYGLLQMAADPANNVVPQWKGTAAEEAMAGDTRTVAQHGFDSYLMFANKEESARLKIAIRTLLEEPQLRQVATEHINRSTLPKAVEYAPLANMFNLKGTPEQRVAGIELLKTYGGEDRAETLLAMALDKENDRVPKYRDSEIPAQFAVKHRTVAQSAYNAYIEASGSNASERYNLALSNGLERPNQRELAMRYLQKSWDTRARGFGDFLEMYNLPGHVSKMQELISNNFRQDPTSQKMIFDRMMQLTDADPRRQMELITDNLHVPALLEGGLTKLEAILGRGTTRQQREEIDYAVTERLRFNTVSTADRTRMTDILAKVTQENRLQDALLLMRKGQNERVTGVHELSVLHDQRAIKPLLQQAVSGNDVVEREAIGALKQFNPNLVKFYAQELKREYYANPLMVGKITDLVGSRRLAPPAAASLPAQSSLQ